MRALPMQCERQGYFARDPDSTADRAVFNRTIGLRDTFAKEVGEGVVGLPARSDHRMQDTAEDIVCAISAGWQAAFRTLDAAMLSSLYSKNAFFFGSNPTLYRGREGVAAYFNTLPRWRATSVANGAQRKLTNSCVLQRATFVTPIGHWQSRTLTGLNATSAVLAGLARRRSL
jgi:hypothetical protein